MSAVGSRTDSTHTLVAPPFGGWDTPAIAPSVQNNSGHSYGKLTVLCSEPTLGGRFNMIRREFITLLGGAAVIPVAARAQQPAMPIVGLVSPRSPEEAARLGAAFRKALNEAGYVEGQNVMVEYH